MLPSLLIACYLHFEFAFSRGWHSFCHLWLNWNYAYFGLKLVKTLLSSTCSQVFWLPSKCWVLYSLTPWMDMYMQVELTAFGMIVNLFPYPLIFLAIRGIYDHNSVFSTLFGSQRNIMAAMDLPSVWLWGLIYSDSSFCLASLFSLSPWS